MKTTPRRKAQCGACYRTVYYPSAWAGLVVICGKCGARIVAPLKVEKIPEA